MRQPFPHILEHKGNSIRVVTDQDIEKGEYLVSRIGYEFNEEKKEQELVYAVYELTSVEHKSPAKGDWSGWNVHPFYYEGKAKFIGKMPEEEINQYL